MDKEKIRAKIDFILENKIAPLGKNIKAAIYAGAVIVPVVLFVYLMVLPSIKEMEKLEKQQVVLQKEISEVEAAAANLDKHKAEMGKTQVLLQKASVLLPQQKDIPSLLTNISKLGSDAGLDFNNFTPGAEVAREFYMEVPISIAVRGPYHSVGSFLYQVSRLDRIVSAFNITMGSPAMDHGEMMLASSMSLVTYRFIEAKDAQK